MVGKNFQRKRFPELIEAFAKFSENKEDTALYLHTQMDYGTNNPGWEMKYLAAKYGVMKKIVFGNMKSLVYGVPDIKMNEIYSTFDVNANISVGEGFGLSSIHGWVHAVPYLALDNSVNSYLIGKNERGILVEPEEKTVTLPADYELDRKLPNVDKITEALEFAYSNRDQLAIMGLNGQKAIVETFNSDKLQPAWENLFDKCFADQETIQEL
jgi:glycosyltransferase involved in cell wall biosynthesis